MKTYITGTYCACRLGAFTPSLPAGWVTDTYCTMFDCFGESYGIEEAHMYGESIKPGGVWQIKLYLDAPICNHIDNVVNDINNHLRAAI